MGLAADPWVSNTPPRRRGQYIYLHPVCRKRRELEIAMRETKRNGAVEGYSKMHKRAANDAFASSSRAIAMCAPRGHTTRACAPTSVDSAKSLFQRPFPSPNPDSSGVGSLIYLPRVQAACPELPGVATAETVVVKEVCGDAPGMQSEEFAALNQPGGIVSPYVTRSVADWPAINWIVMKLVPGACLYEARVAGCLVGKERKGKKAMSQILQGAKTIIDAGYLHDDMKPKNVMYDSQSETFTWIDIGKQRGSCSEAAYGDPEMKTFAIVSAFHLCIPRPAEYAAEEFKLGWGQGAAKLLNKKLSASRGFFDTPSRGIWKGLTEHDGTCTGLKSHMRWAEDPKSHRKIKPGAEARVRDELVALGMPTWMAEATCLLLQGGGSVAYTNAISYLDGKGRSGKARAWIDKCTSIALNVV